MTQPAWIAATEARYNARYVGFYDLPDREGPFHVFYTENPDRSLGHDNYFGIFSRPENLMDRTGPWVTFITNAASIRDAVFSAHRLSDGTFLCSRYRHDYQEREGKMIDGGLAYVRSSIPGPDYQMRVVDGQEVFAPVQQVQNNH
jgi:hypothetical protein